MIEFKTTCTFETTDKLLVVKERKSKCIFSNPNRHTLTKVIVDGCQITDGVKCDYLILDHCRNEYFVELKGKDLPHAVEQLAATIQQLSDKNSIVIQRAQKEFKKKYNTELIAKNIQAEIIIK